MDTVDKNPNVKVIAEEANVTDIAQKMYGVEFKKNDVAKSSGTESHGEKGQIKTDRLLVMPEEKSEVLDNTDGAIGLAKFDKKLSAVENLRNLTSSLELMHRSRNFYTVS